MSNGREEVAYLGRLIRLRQEYMRTEHGGAVVAELTRRIEEQRAKLDAAMNR